MLIKYKIYISGKYISTKENTYADALSRLDPYPFFKMQKDLPNWSRNASPLPYQDCQDSVDAILTKIEKELKIKL